MIDTVTLRCDKEEIARRVPLIVGENEKPEVQYSVLVISVGEARTTHFRVAVIRKSRAALWMMVH